MPHPPGDYPVIVIGSGPGALQVSHSLGALGVPHAVLSADPAPGGMFRRWPHFQRLLSWTKPHALAALGTPAYERSDWNSLLTQEPAARSLQAGLMDGASSFPTRAEMEANLVTFAERAGIQVRYGCTWLATRRLDGGDGMRFGLDTSDGPYRCATLVVAVGVAEPWLPQFPGVELVHHYGQVRPAEEYAGKRVCIIGKQNSGFELANGMLQWACQLVLASPSPTSLSVVTRTLVGVRARYLQPFEDAMLGGGVTVIDAAIERVEAAGTAKVVHLRRTDREAALSVEVDEVIAATGFTAPLQDLPALGVAVVGQSRLPVQTPWWESTTVAGIHFAGTITQGARGLRRHGVPSNSGAVHGARYNARLLAGRIAEAGFGVVMERPVMARTAAVARIARDLTESPELFHQRGYLARVYSADASGGLRDEGTQPLEYALDAPAAAPTLAVTLESDGSGAIYPVLYSRSRGALREHVLEPDQLLRYDGVDARRSITEAVDALRPL